ncbi:MAG TPA: hypothetical protein ENH94_10405 [Phycisphaerales bacterium]|nr:hypothetical protein [Phycisphaerales bacterium]
MKEVKKPMLTLPIVATIAALFAMISLGLAVSQNEMKLGLRLMSIVSGSLVIFFSLAQWPIYLKQYIDYRFQEIEKEKQEV